MRTSTSLSRFEAFRIPKGSFSLILPALLILFAFFSPVSHAAVQPVSVSAQLYVSGVQMASGLETYSIRGNFSNPTPQPVTLYVSQDGVSNSEKFIAALEPATSASISFDVSSNSTLQNSSISVWAYYPDNSKILIAGLGLPANPNYPDKDVSQEIRQAYGFLLPVFLALFLGYLALLAIFVKKHASETSNHGEFTLKSLLMPSFGAKSTLFEKVSAIFTNPVLWLDEALFVLVLLALINSQLSTLAGPDEALRIVCVAGIGAGVLPLLYLIGAYLLDFKVAHKPFRLFFAFFMWGAFSAVIAFFANSILSSALGSFGIDLSSASAVVLATAIASPLIEESVKGFGVYIGSKSRAFDSVPTGMLLGFACGIGFSFVENWFYFTSRTTPFELGFGGWVALIVYRSFFNCLSHGIFTGSVGGFIGYLKGHPAFASKYHFGAVPGVIFAIILHSIFNSSAIIDTLAISQYDFAFFIFNPFVAVVFNLLFVLVLFLSIREFWAGGGKKGSN